MPAITDSRREYLMEVYFPATSYAQILEYTLKEVEAEQEAFRELDSLILKANANVARLSETYRERAPSPGQQIDLRDARYVIDQYRAGVAASRASAQNTATNPGAAGIAQVEDIIVSNPDAATAAQNIVEVAEREANKYSNNPALSRLAFRQIIEFAQSKGVDVPELARIEFGPSLRRAFGEDATFNSVVAQTNSEADQDARRRYAGSAGTSDEDLQAIAEDPSKPADIRRAARSIIASESEYAHGRKESGLEPGQEELVQLFLNHLRDEDTPGQALESEFDNPKQYAEARAAYEAARDSAAYFKTDAEWFAAEFLSAVRTEAALKKRKEEGPTYEDPYREAQRRALDRGGYTPEDIHFMLYHGNPAQARVRPSFARAYGDITPQTEQERLVADLWQKSGETLDVNELQNVLVGKSRQFRGPLIGPRPETREGRKAARAEQRERAREMQEMYSPENIEKAIHYLIALKLRRDGIVGGGLEGVGEPAEVVAPLTGDEERVVSQDDLAEAAFAREQAQAQARQEAEETEIEPRIAPEPEPEPEPIELGGGVISVDEAEAAEPAGPHPPGIQRRIDEAYAREAAQPGVGEIGYEFVDESDPAQTRYRRTEQGFVALDAEGNPVGNVIFGPSIGGIALTLAERGQYEQLTELQDRLAAERARRRREAGEAAPPTPTPAPAPEAGQPPPGAPATLGLAGAVTGSPFSALTPEEAARLEARRAAAEGVAPAPAAPAPAAPAPAATPAPTSPVRMRWNPVTNRMEEVTGG